MKRTPVERARDWSENAGALSGLLDEQLDECGISEREKCFRRQKFMDALDHAHSAAFNGLYGLNVIREKSGQMQRRSR